MCRTSSRNVIVDSMLLKGLKSYFIISGTHCSDTNMGLSVACMSSSQTKMLNFSHERKRPADHKKVGSVKIHFHSGVSY